MLKTKVTYVFMALLFSSVAAFAGGPDMINPLDGEDEMKKIDLSEEEVIKPVADETVKTNDEEMVPISEVMQPSDSRTAKSGDGVEVRYAATNEKRVNILFESDPPNAELVINGLYVGSTPVQVPLRDGVHNVRMGFIGYIGWERQIKAYKGLRVFATLEADKVTKK